MNSWLDYSNIDILEGRKLKFTNSFDLFLTKDRKKLTITYGVSKANELAGSDV